MNIIKLIDGVIEVKAMTAEDILVTIPNIDSTPIEAAAGQKFGTWRGE